MQVSRKQKLEKELKNLEERKKKIKFEYPSQIREHKGEITRLKSDLDKAGRLQRILESKHTNELYKLDQQIVSCEEEIRSLKEANTEVA